MAYIRKHCGAPTFNIMDDNSYLEPALMAIFNSSSFFCCIAFNKNYKNLKTKSER